VTLGARTRKTLPYIVATSLLILTIFPLFWMVSFSFKGLEELTQFPEPLYWLPQRPTLSNYEEAFATFTGLKAIWESLSIASVSTVLYLRYSSAFRLPTQSPDNVFTGQGFRFFSFLLSCASCLLQSSLSHCLSSTPRSV